MFLTYHEWADMTLALPIMKAERRPNTTTLLPLNQYDLCVVCFSGGKDSLALVLQLLEAGVPREKIELWHQHIDGGPESEHFFDWPCTEAYCRAVAQALGVRIRFQWKEGGFEREMLRDNAPTAPTFFELNDGSIGTAGGKSSRLGTRKLFPQVSPNLAVRWCSSYLKIDVAAVAMNNDPDLKKGNVLILTGERREESAARSRYAELERHRCTREGRRVDQWRAVINQAEDEVWAIIQRWKIRPHPAYLLGFGRVSCMCCIFGNSDQWATIQRIAPERFAKIAAYEQQFGKTIHRTKSVTELAQAGMPYIESGFTPLVQRAMSTTYPVSDIIVQGNWAIPAGAFKYSGGPN
jgi:3'-phosphoadenosine 5'-phosphosulfate sulfotransferase (PAPS reductase)/FAD synthetase